MLWAYSVLSFLPVFDEKELDRYRRVYRLHKTKTEAELDQKILDTFGRQAHGNIARGISKPDARRSYLESYKREYQTFLDAFEVVRKAYQATGRRMVPEDKIPLRIEIDQFFSYIREEHAVGDAYKKAPLLTGTEQDSFISDYAGKFINGGWHYLTNDLVVEKYPRIIAGLGSSKAIENGSAEDLYNALDVVHAFHDRFRFYDGGRKTQKAVFLAENDLGQLRKTLLYLLHDLKEDFITRIADCIYSREYRLYGFGHACVQETYGWVNSDDVPICNGRTLKSLRWLGFDIPVA